jgi:hypothetical protein
LYINIISLRYKLKQIEVPRHRGLGQIDKWEGEEGEPYMNHVSLFNEF